MPLVIAYALAVFAGGSLVVQQGLNSNVRIALNSAAWSGVVSYAVGLACMGLLVLAVRDPAPSVGAAARLPWWGWSGGAFGAVFIGAGIFIVPRLGAATFFGLVVAGQMLGSLLFDQFGLLGVPQRPVDLARVAGAALLVAGVFLIRR